MRYDDEALERALSALPLEEAPPDLHARIVAAALARREQMFKTWELWLIGFACSVAVWLIFAITGNPLGGGVPVSRAFAQVSQLLVDAFRPTTMLWLGVGVLTAFIVSQLSFTSGSKA